MTTSIQPQLKRLKLLEKLLPGFQHWIMRGLLIELSLIAGLDSSAWLDCLMVQIVFSLLVYSTFESSLTSLDSEFPSVIQSSVLSYCCTKPMINKITWIALCFYLKLLLLWILHPKDSLQSARKPYYESFLMVICFGTGEY